MARFQKGQSGNPKGRPKGIADKRVKFRELLQPHAEELVTKAVALAREGDTTALRLCLERIIPPIKAKGEPVKVPGLKDAQTLSEQGEAIISEVANGGLSPEDASALMTSLNVQARIVEIDELERRITALEEKG